MNDYTEKETAVKKESNPSPCPTNETRIPEMIKTMTPALTTTITRTLAFLAARTSVNPSNGDLLAKSWKTTAGLVAVNVALIAVLVGSVRVAQAQTPQWCNECYQGIHYWTGTWAHATWQFRRSEPLGYGIDVPPHIADEPCLWAHIYPLCCIPT